MPALKNLERVQLCVICFPRLLRFPQLVQHGNLINSWSCWVFKQFKSQHTVGQKAEEVNLFPETGPRSGGQERLKQATNDLRDQHSTIKTCEASSSRNTEWAKPPESGGNAQFLFSPLPACSPQLDWDLLFDGSRSVCVLQRHGAIWKTIHCRSRVEKIHLCSSEKRSIFQKCGNMPMLLIFCARTTFLPLRCATSGSSRLLRDQFTWLKFHSNF